MRQWKCPSCGTFHVEHLKHATALNPVSGAIGVDASVLEAINFRRLCQAEQIRVSFQEFLNGANVLDYGCGHGSFTNLLLEHSMNADGCDIAFFHPDLNREHFFLVSSPWGLPDVNKDWNLISLFDVLEHNTEPLKFLNFLKLNNFSKILIKVPNVRGPLALVARLMWSLGVRSPWSSMLLAGDSSPHVLYFSSKGLCRLLERAGYEVQQIQMMAEVGSELCNRLRTHQRYGIGPLAKAAGIVLEKLAFVWSDTFVVSAEIKSP